MSQLQFIGNMTFNRRVWIWWIRVEGWLQWSVVLLFNRFRLGDVCHSISLIFVSFLFFDIYHICCLLSYKYCVIVTVSLLVAILSSSFSFFIPTLIYCARARDPSGIASLSSQGRFQVCIHSIRPNPTCGISRVCCYCWSQRQ